MTKATRFFLALAIVAGASIINASPLASVGDWDILGPVSEGGDCSMRRAFPDGLVVEAGFVSEKKGAFFAAYHPDWSDIEVGETVFVAFHFGEVGFGGDVEAVEANGLKGGYAFFDNPAFTKELARRDSLTITGPRGDKTEVSLSGTSRAIAAVEECQSAN